jgi:hypothetical protein
VEEASYIICSTRTIGEQKIFGTTSSASGLGFGEEKDMAQKSAGGNAGGTAKKGGQEGARGGRGGGGKGGSGSGGATKSKGGGK